MLSKEFFDFHDDLIVDQTKEDGYHNTLQQCLFLGIDVGVLEATRHRSKVKTNKYHKIQCVTIEF